MLAHAIQQERNRLSRLQVPSVAPEMRQDALERRVCAKRTIEPLSRRSLRAYDGGAVSHSSSAIIPRRQATERGCVHRRDGADSAALRPLHGPNAPLKGALRRVAVVRVESRQI